MPRNESSSLAALLSILKQWNSSLSSLRRALSFWWNSHNINLYSIKAKARSGNISSLGMTYLFFILNRKMSMKISEMELFNNQMKRCAPWRPISQM